MVRSSGRRTTPQPNDRPKEPPRARSTRSQSRDLGEDGEPPRLRRNPRRTDRQASVESLGSLDGRDSNTGRTTRGKVPKKSATVAPSDLSIIAESSPARSPDASGEPAEEDKGQDTLSVMQGGGPRVDTSPGATSVVSIATAISAFSSVSAADAADLDPDMLVDAISELFQSSEALVRAVSPSNATIDDLRDIARDVKIPGSKVSKNLASRETAYLAWRCHFGSDEYIRRDVILRSMLGVRSTNDLPPAAWRPDEVLYHANLASFAKKIMTSERESETTLKAIIQLDVLFPLPFLDSFLPAESASQSLNIGASGLIEDTFRIGLELRTQLAIMVLAQRQNEESFDPNKSITEVFFLEQRDSRGEDSSRTGTIRGWEIAYLGGKGIPMALEYEEMIEQRISEIREYFDDNRDAAEEGWVELDALGAQFSWSDFTVKVLDWVRRRSSEIEEQVNRRGGVERLAEALRSEVDARKNPTSYQRAITIPDSSEGEKAQSYQSALDAEQSQESELPPQPEAISIATKANIALLKNREKRLSGQVVSPEVRRVEQEQAEGVGEVEEDEEGEEGEEEMEFAEVAAGGTISGNISIPKDDYRAYVDDTDEYPIAEGEVASSTAPLSTQERLQQIRRFEKQNKENIKRTQEAVQEPPRRSFIDRQPNAQKVQFSEESQESEEIPETVDEPQSGTKRKRQPQDEDDESDSEYFEEDTRPSEASKRRRIAPPAPAIPQASAQSRASQPSSSQPPPPRTLTTVNRPPAVRAASPDDGDAADEDTETEEDPNSKASQYKTVNNAAKMRAAVQRRKEPRVRHPWTPEEVETLIRLIEKLGCSWAMIKAYDDKGDKVLRRRTQVDLKDKARNMKVDYLTARVGMPRNFDSVPLSKQLENRLASRGITEWN